MEIANLDAYIKALWGIKITVEDQNINITNPVKFVRNSVDCDDVIVNFHGIPYSQFVIHPDHEMINQGLSNYNFFNTYKYLLPEIECRTNFIDGLCIQIIWNNNRKLEFGIKSPIQSLKQISEDVVFIPSEIKFLIK
jgi:hypothetical protein